MTVNSSSVIGDVSDLSVTNPTGLNTSPFLNPKPGLVISKDLTSKRVDPIPVVLLPPTSMFRSNPVPVSVVAPTPTLDTPVTGKFSYLGTGASTLGFAYPLPPPTTLNINVPPIPTVAVTVAPVPTVSAIPIRIIPSPVVLIPERYPDPWKSLVPIPTDVIDPPAPRTAVTDAPAKGAIPSPPLNPIDIICPDLGN